MTDRNFEALPPPDAVGDEDPAPNAVAQHFALNTGGSYEEVDEDEMVTHSMERAYLLSDVEPMHGSMQKLSSPSEMNCTRRPRLSGRKIP